MSCIVLSLILAVMTPAHAYAGEEVTPSENSAAAVQEDDKESAPEADTGEDADEEADSSEAAASGQDAGSSSDGSDTPDPVTEVSANATASVSADTAADEDPDELFPGEKEWLKKHGLKKNADGMYEYIDEYGKLWIFDPEDPELFKYFSDDKEEPQEYAPVRNRMNGFYDGDGVVYSDPYLFPMDGRNYRYPPYYQNTSPRPVIRYGIDVSKFQGVISQSSWRTMKETYGMDFAFIRAGYRGYGDSGSLNVDNCFASNITNAYNAGVKVGVYYFSQATSESEARAEADHCMEICSPYKSKITLPMVIDYEYNGNPGRLKKADLSASKHTSIVNAFCSRVKDKGYVPMIYANKSMLLDDMHVSDIPSDYLIWMANFSNKNAPDINSTSYSKRLSCWQFTSQYAQFGTSAVGKGLISSAYVDMDFWYGYFPNEVYPVTFNTNGGSRVATQQIKPDGKVKKPDDPTKTGHIFLGWYKDASLTTPWNFDTDTIKGKTTIYAKWEAMPLVTFDTAGGSSIASQYVPKGGKATRPAASPTRNGYVFDDWYRDKSYAVKWDFETQTVSANVTIYAHWLKKCNFTFDPDGGSRVPSQVVIEGELAQVPEDPTKEGHTFRGWYKDKARTQAWDFAVDRAADHTTLYALWEINKYTVSFDSLGGSAVEPQIVEWNNFASKPAAPAMADHEFKGWYQDAALTKAWRFDEYRVRDDLMLYARWSGFEGWKSVPEEIDGRTVSIWKYYRDATVQTGWLNVGGSIYYLADAADVAAGKARVIGERFTGSQEISHRISDGGSVISVPERYYFNRKGVLQTGWIADGTGSGRHYYDPTQGGAMAHDVWITEGKKRYHLDTEGNKETGENGVLTAGGYYYAVDSNGAVKTGWVKHDDKWYYYGTSDDAHYGARVGAGELVIGGKQYLIGADGSRYSGWSADGERYYDTNGVLSTGWKKIEGDWYYFYPAKVEGSHALGDKAKGLVPVDGRLYSFDEVTGKRAGGGESVEVTTKDSEGHQTTSEAKTNRSGVVKPDEAGFVRTSDGSEVYLGSNGSLITNAWVTIADDKVRVGADGMVQKGKAKIDGKVYLFNDDGTVDKTLPTGWVSEGGKRVYYDEDGVLQTDKVVKVGRDLYGFDGSGGILSDGMYRKKDDGSIEKVTGEDISAALYIVKSDGTLYTGWYSEGGRQYYFSAENGAKLTGVHKIGPDRYYFEGTGEVTDKKEAWVDEDRTYFVNKNGVLKTGWYTEDGKTYYLGKDGERRDGVVKAGTRLYYQTKDGIVKAPAGSGIQLMTAGGKKYAVNEKGVLKTGWQTIEGTRYYFDKTDGAALTGTQQIKGIWYSFD